MKMIINKVIKLLRGVIGHKHEPIWESRKVVENTTLDFTVSNEVDIMPAKKYLYKGYCLKCSDKLEEIHIIANMFDQEQPYDNTGNTDN